MKKRSGMFWMSDIGSAVDDVVTQAVQRENALGFAHAVGRKLLELREPLIEDDDCRQDPAVRAKVK